MATGSTTWLSNILRVTSALGFVFALTFVSTLVACGGGGGGSSPSSSSSGGATPTLSLLAGNADGFGNVDGTGSAARFTTPVGLAVDGWGNIYVVDRNDYTIRKITPAGVVTTLAGASGTCGSADGRGSAASFCNPSGVALDGSGNIYVTDSGNHTIRKITPAGDVTTLAGTANIIGSTDGIGAAASFYYPTGITVDNAGNVYVADSNNQTIRKITPMGNVTTLAGTTEMPGRSDGTGTAANFSHPQGIAADNAGNIYVADTNNGSIRKITPAGVVTTLADTAALDGTADGTAATTSFAFPSYIVVDSSGNLYVTDRFAIRKITANGTVTTLAGSTDSRGITDGTADVARFASPEGIAVDGSGTLYVADAETIRKITAAGIVTTLAGAAPIHGREDGMGNAARFSYPRGTAVDGSGNVYVADSLNSAIRKITPTGLTSTLADMPGVSDGTLANEISSAPEGVAVDSAGNIYVINRSHHTINKITADGNITTLAGTPGTSGSTDGMGATARFSRPEGIAVDGAGNVYVADSGNETIRMITPAGVVTTLAGLAGSTGSADGMAAAARFNYPTGVAVDNAGNIYVGDRNDHTIRKITPAGLVTTLAGSAESYGSADGTGAAARFNFPTGVAVDASGNVYVADSDNHTIRKITPAGVVTTVVGRAGMASFVPGPLPGLLTAPIGVAIGGGSLYITTNHAVVKVSNVP